VCSGNEQGYFKERHSFWGSEKKKNNSWEMTPLGTKRFTKENTYRKNSTCFEGSKW
jgi:hypothetical protein